MNLFDQLVREALRARPELGMVRAVVEKELLHHDILREMSGAGFLEGLTFIGGTCLRACFGAVRLSEDLDFTGGADFTRELLTDLGRLLETRLEARYGLEVTVAEPTKETTGVETWKLRMITEPSRKDLPAQRIHIDICAIPSHQRRPMMLRNPYGVDLGTSGLVLQVQSREEILADKVIALAFRPNRIKNRDLWDIAWLKQQGIELPLVLIPKKIEDHRQTAKSFGAQLAARLALLQSEPAVRGDFVREMQRFLPVAVVRETVEKEAYWAYLTDLVSSECSRAMNAV